MAHRAIACRNGLRRPSPSLRFAGTTLVLASLFAFNPISCFAAATLSQQIDPPEVAVGDQVTVTFTVLNGSASGLRLPQVDGLEVLGTSSSTGITIVNGSMSSADAESFHLVPTRSGDFTIPAFDIPLQDGGALHTKPIKFHVLSNGNAPSNPSPAPAPTQSPSLPSFNPNGPVVMPPNNGVAPDTSGNSSGGTTSEIKVPMESDGRPAKVFVVITPQTTDAYVGQSIPMRIEWYIRLDVDAQQDSLPTIKGSDFLMNNLSTRPQEEEVEVANERYRRESWVTAISAPKSGDIPLQMERDTYWVKSNEQANDDPFSTFFSHPSLAHESIPSNPLTIHVHDLPQEGRPPHFTGAIGQFQVTGSAQPQSVAVGEPVTLHFTVNGEGNFDYVKCPSLIDDPAWKSYVPSAKTEYQEESHTQATKVFEQAIIPQKNGSLSLPQATFSYFDPAAKQYVTIPIALPPITVTGSALPAFTTSPDSATNSATMAGSAPKPPDFAPNRLEIGSLQTSLAPVYRQPWFWAVQAGLISMLLLGTLFSFWRSRCPPDRDRAEGTLRRRSLQQEENAMSEAVRVGDARAFFFAARHAVQLQLGAQWHMKPETLTLGEISQHSPSLAETLKPLFLQADEVIYSGQTSADLNLAQWELHVRQELLQSQAA